MQQTSATHTLPLIPQAKIAILQSSWHRQQTDNMLEMCERVLLNLGATIEKHILPGALELPIAAKTLLTAKRDYQALICFGAVLKGETFHFELVANTSAQALMQVSLEFNVPIINEVLACYNLKQLKERSANNELNKGLEAAEAAARMIAWCREVKGKVSYES